MVRVRLVVQRAATHLGGDHRGAAAGARPVTGVARNSLTPFLERAVLSLRSGRQRIHAAEQHHPGATADPGADGDRRADLDQALLAAECRDRDRATAGDLWGLVLVRLPALGFHQDAAVVDTDLEGAGRFIGRGGQRRTALQAEAREVARTDDLALLDVGGGEGLTIVGAA